jgi:glycosyltransferase involved in cell wall biosynthesis
MAKKLASFGQVTLATPGQSGPTPVSSIEMENLSNPLLSGKVGYIYFWNASLAVGRDNPYDRLGAWLTRREINTERSWDLVVCESPQVVRAGYAVTRNSDASLLVNKHNASHQILSSFLASTAIPRLIAARAIKNHRAHEQWAIDIADAVVFQSTADRNQFRCPPDTQIAVIPNGTDVDRDVSDSTVATVRKEFRLDSDRFTCVFVGSYDYAPNREAARRIDEEIAPSLPEVTFLLIGRDPISTNSDNVRELGFVDNLSAILALSDVALCPLSSGSGTKLKMMDYLAAGLPIVTTPTGATGIDLLDGETALICESTSAFVEAIERLVDSPELRARLAQNAAELGESYSWETLLAEYDSILINLLTE